MAVIYLQHPVHGCKVACGEHEARMDEANGWTRYDPNALRKPENDFLNTLGITQKSKRGK